VLKDSASQALRVQILLAFAIVDKATSDMMLSSTRLLVKTVTTTSRVPNTSRLQEVVPEYRQVPASLLGLT
jgi:hypothetical protein